MNDAWLLKMEGAVWTWKKVNMHNTEWAPTRIWCHQACKVIILLIIQLYFVYNLLYILYSKYFLFDRWEIILLFLALINVRISQMI